MKIVILYDIFIILWTIVDDFRHYYTIKAALKVDSLERKNWHTAAAVEVCVMIFFLSIFPVLINFDEKFPIILSMFQMYLIYVVIHNLGISYLLYKNPFYIGTTDTFDKMVRKILKNNSKLFWIYPAFLVILIVILTIIICLHYYL